MELLSVKLFLQGDQSILVSTLKNIAQFLEAFRHLLFFIRARILQQPVTCGGFANII